jgi:hypothetical protein
MIVVPPSTRQMGSNAANTFIAQPIHVRTMPMSVHTMHNVFVPNLPSPFQIILVNVRMDSWEMERPVNQESIQNHNPKSCLMGKHLPKRRSKTTTTVDVPNQPLTLAVGFLLAKVRIELMSFILVTE